MRRWAWLVGTSVVLAACGLDVVGTDPAAITTPDLDARPFVPGADARIDEGGANPEAGTDAKTDGPAPDASVPPTPQLIEDKITDVRSITVSPTSLYIARAGTVIQWTGGGRQTVDSVTNARALAWGNDQLFYVKDDSIGRYKTDADRDEHAGETNGVDVLYAGIRPVGSFQRKVVSYALGGPDADQTFGDVKVISADEERPCGIASDGTTVFWTNRTQGYLGRAPINDGSKQEKLITGLTSPNSVVVDGGDLYFAHGSSIVKAPKGDPGPYDASKLTPLYTGIGTPMALAVNGDNLYWLDAASGSLRRAPKAAGSTSVVTTLANGGDSIDIALPRLIAFAENYVYWAQPVDGAVYRTPK